MNLRKPDFPALRRALTLDGTPERLPAMELHADDEIMEAVLGRPASRKDALSLLPFQQKMGYDYINVYSDLKLEFNRNAIVGDAAGGLAERREFIDEQSGPITSAEEFDAYPWPDPAAPITCSQFDAVRPLLSEGMALVARCHGPFEWGTWLMGVERFCMQLVMDRPLVERVFRRVSELIVAEVAVMVRQPGVGAVWISDDLGFNSGTFISPADLEALVFPTYREIVRLSREQDLPVLLHSCGNLKAVLPTLVECGINALHSLPPMIYDLAELKRDWGDRLCLLGNVDVDLLSRGTPDDVRQAVRRVHEIWAAEPRGGVVLSSSNSIPNYARVENYLAMMDECHKA